MGRVIAVTNQKGGVGKTTTSVNLAASLAITRRRVLLLDLDPQGNATMGCGIDKRSLATSAYDVLLDGRALASVVVPLSNQGFEIVPSNGALTGAEVALLSVEGREQRLRRALEPVVADYDYVFIDCPPALNMLTVNALCAAHSVIIPMQCEYYALEGLSALIETIERIRQVQNPALRIEGLLRTMFDARNNLASQVSAELLTHFGAKVYRTTIPRNVRLAEAPSHGLPVLYYDKTSSGAIAYLALAGEMLRRDGAENGAAA